MAIFVFHFPPEMSNILTVNIVNWVKIVLLGGRDGGDIGLFITLVQKVLL